MAENLFELVGRVGWMDISTTDKGTIITKINLGVKVSKEEWNNFFITFMNSAESKKRIAEQIAEQCKEGDYIRVKGVLRVDKFTPKNGEKEVEKVSLIGWLFNHVKFDEFEKRFIDV
ncbi:MAG: hypothetical protein E7Z87_08170 [Cyanobacteria bacterium SIG26]|nr:hypothetical protein [Cyanobacteria bacterium SIG26]